VRKWKIAKIIAIIILIVAWILTIFFALWLKDFVEETVRELSQFSRITAEIDWKE